MQKDKKECPKKYSCNYFKNRFGVTECNEFRSVTINVLHKQELKAREKMLKEVKNYGR